MFAFISLSKYFLFVGKCFKKKKKFRDFGRSKNIIFRKRFFSGMTIREKFLRESVMPLVYSVILSKFEKMILFL